MCENSFQLFGTAVGSQQRYLALPHIGTKKSNHAISSMYQIVTAYLLSAVAWQIPINAQNNF